MGLRGVLELVHVEARGRRVFVYFMISSILSQIYYTIWDRYPKIINVFGLYFMEPYPIFPIFRFFPP